MAVRANPTRSETCLTRGIGSMPASASEIPVVSPSSREVLNLFWPICVAQGAAGS